MRNWSRIVPFLKQYRGEALRLLACAAVFAGVFAVYKLPPEAPLYAALLSALFGVITLAVRFRAFCRRLDVLESLRKNTALRLAELPAPETPVEERYAALLSEMRASLTARIDALEAERQESLDYYTAWVHQIKTPIAVMRMELQGEDTEQNRALLDELFRVEQYAEMVLSWQRLNAGASDLVFSKISVDETVRAAVRKYAPLLVRRGIRLEFAPSGETALSDAKWLGFILEQFLSNAAKYAKGGTVTIRCEGGLLRVADDGVGIPPEDLPRIFEKGFTGLNGRDESRATGLGLYLVRRTAKLLGHTVTVQSRLGEGSVFTVDLNRDAVRLE